MSTYYYEDPIENFESEGDVDYYDQEGLYEGGQGVRAHANQPMYDYYDDLDQEYELSSPSPVNPLDQSYNRQYSDRRDHAYPESIQNFREQPSYAQHQRVSQGNQSTRDNSRSQVFNQNHSSQQGQPHQRSMTQNCNMDMEATSERSFYPATSKEPPKPRNAYGIRLRPVSDLPDKFRSLFKFGVFNAVQSTCFDEVVGGDRNMVISAPTGSGKTVLFELAMIRTLEKTRNSSKPVKCIYIAPTKALCTEKFQDWAAKFEPIGFKCCELTGDTVVFGNSAWGEAKHASIIVTTCEKWDSLTRNWHDHEAILSQIELFLVDEVHILNETRGSTLEVVTSRMKLRRPSMRFILVSATVPNIQDVADWIGNGFGKSDAAQVFEFGDDYRPCKLTRHVVGVPRKHGMNDFQYAKILDYKLFSTIQQFSVGKPILIFCSTRKGVFGTAEQLMKEYIESEAKKSALPWARPARIAQTFSDKRLDELAAIGIGVHHAGLTLDDRRSTEQLYLNKTLRILVATSTLAVGVNLPAHMVVIKGVHTFQNNASREYSDLDIMQMLGRAGRPQFDKDGIAVILCEIELESKYRALVQGKTVLESSLHLNLAEHLNSEIGLGTITDMTSAKQWLHSSFLYQRLQKNAQYYALIKPDGSQSITPDGDDLVLQSVEQLKATELVEHVEHGKKSGNLRSTEYGETMSKYYIRRATMELILNLPERATLREILETVCAAEEFQDCKLRASEKTLYAKLKKDIDIRFEVKKVEKTSDKIFLLVQAVLGGISFNGPDYKATDSQPHLEAFSVFKHIARIVRAVVDVALIKKDGAQLQFGLQLFRCLSAKAWEDRAIVLRQIEHLGEKSIKVLAEHGITSLAHLRKQNPLRIEALLNRRPPFGLEVLSSLGDLPQYKLGIKEIRVNSDGGRSPVEVTLKVDCSLVEQNTSSAKPRKSRNRSFDRTVVLTITSEMEFVDFRRIPSKALKGVKSFEITAELKKPSQSITVIITSESIAGVALQQTYKPNVKPGEYPVMDTRPITSVEMDLIGLEDDPDFWNMNLDSGSSEVKPTIEPGDKPEKVPAQETMQPKRREPSNAEPKVRADGRYDCNHLCKDKTKCHHYCCLNGMTDPPKAKKIAKDDQENKSKSAKDGQVDKPKLPSKVQRLHPPKKALAPSKQDKVLKQLDDIHDRAQAVNNYRLPEGQQRLKMDSLQQGKRKRLPPAEYDIQFTDLKDPDEQPSASIDFPDSFSDEDLPISIIPRSSSRAEAQEDDEVDRLRSDELSGIAGPSKKDKAEPPKKRMRRDMAHSPPRKSGPQKQSEQLFLSSDSEGSVEFVIPLPTAAANTKSQEHSWYAEDTTDNPSTYSQQTDSTLKTAGSDNIPATIPVHVQIEEVEEEDNDFAELDAWIKSGAVEIV